MEELALFGGRKEINFDFGKLRTKIKDKHLSVLAEKIKEGILYSPSGDGVIKEFENAFAEFIGRKYAVATSSGTMALFSAYFALGLNEGDNVLCPCYGYHASVYPMFYQRLEPLFCEIEEESLNIDPEELQKRINNKTRALSMVSMWGIPPDYKSISNFLKQRNLSVIEDVSRSFCGIRDDFDSGRFADISCFSLNAYKVISTGEGGILATDDSSFCDRASILGQPVHLSLKTEKYKKYFDTALGIKHKINPVAACLGLLQLPEAKKRQSQSQENFECLTDRISQFDFLKPLMIPKNSKRGSWSGFSMFYSSKEIDGLDKKLFVDALRMEGCNILREYGSNLLHTTEAYQDNLISKKEPFFKRGDYPKSEKLIGDLLIMENICSYQIPTFNLIDQYVNAIQKVYDNRKKLKEYKREVN